MFKITSKYIAPFLFVFFLLNTSPVIAGWQLEWIDNFDGTRVNKSNWTSQTQANYNNEVQCYTDDDTSENKNYDVSNGTLKIIARKGTNSCFSLGGITKSWKSGRINSKDKREFLYGRIEARIRFNDLRAGSWPAFWMLENRIGEQPFRGDNDFVGWPNPGAGEIDVWEWYSNGAGSYITNFFNTGNCGGEVRYSYPGGAPDVQQWHSYAMEWNENTIKFFIDNNLVTSHDVSNCAQYKEPMFILLNVAMGGTLGGSIDPTLTTATMEVDYVAHCSSSISNTFSSCSPNTPTETVPIISSFPQITVQTDNLYNYRLVAYDVDGDNLEFTSIVVPSWLTFNSTTGELSGIPTNANEGNHVVVLSVNDGINIVNQSFNITVFVPITSTPTVSQNNPPTLSSSANLQAQIGVNYQNTIIASDVDNDSLILSAPVIGNWMVFNSATGVLSGTPNNTDIGNHNVTISVTDGIDTVNQSLIINVESAPSIPSNSAPVFLSSPMTDGKVGNIYNYSPTTNDSDNDETQITVSTLPEWLTYKSDINVLTGTPGANDVGLHQVNISVSDGEVTVIQEFEILVAQDSVETPSSSGSSSGGGSFSLFLFYVLSLLLAFRVKSAKKWGGVFFTKLAILNS